MPLSTVATFLLLVSHVTVVSAPSSAVTSGLRVSVSPTVRSSVSGETVMPVTFGSAGSSTVTEQVSTLSPALAVMMAVPFDLAVTVPLSSTAAMSSWSLLHSMLTSSEVVTRVSVSPISRVSFVCSMISSPSAANAAGIRPATRASARTADRKRDSFFGFIETAPSKLL